MSFLLTCFYKGMRLPTSLWLLSRLKYVPKNYARHIWKKVRVTNAGCHVCCMLMVNENQLTGSESLTVLLTKIPAALMQAIVSHVVIGSLLLRNSDGERTVMGSLHDVYKMNACSVHRVCPSVCMFLLQNCWANFDEI